MRGRSSYQPPGMSANGKSYAETFVRKIHKLLSQGYAMLKPVEFSSAEEEVITGELVRVIGCVLDDVSAPHWMQWFSVHEEPRIHDPVRKGKRRLRLDIRFDSSQERPRSKMRFEAKRLGPNHGTAIYLGDEGIQCFLDGRYAHNDSIAGMLGYVQKGNSEDWANKIEIALKRDAAKLGLRKSGWSRKNLVPELSSTFSSNHDRRNINQPIEIFHTFLLFN